MHEAVYPGEGGPSCSLCHVAFPPARGPHGDAHAWLQGGSAEQGLGAVCDGQTQWLMQPWHGWVLHVQHAAAWTVKPHCKLKGVQLPSQAHCAHIGCTVC